MVANCPRCGALFIGGTCHSCGYSGPPEAAPAVDVEPVPGLTGVDETTEPIAPVEGLLGSTPKPEEESGPPQWEARRRLGVLRAFWLTWRESMFRPVPFFRDTAPSASKGAAVGYFVIVAVLGLFFRLFWLAFENVVSGGTADLATQLGLELAPEQGFAVYVLSSFVALMFLTLLNVALLYVSAAIVHSGFAIVGAGRQGFGATLLALTYSSGPLLFFIFPFFGVGLMLIWGSVLIFIAMRELQRTTNGKATLGFLVPLMILFVLSFLAALLIAVLIGVSGIQPPIQ